MGENYAFVAGQFALPDECTTLLLQNHAWADSLSAAMTWLEDPGLDGGICFFFLLCNLSTMFLKI